MMSFAKMLLNVINQSACNVNKLSMYLLIFFFFAEFFCILDKFYQVFVLLVRLFEEYLHFVIKFHFNSTRVLSAFVTSMQFSGNICIQWKAFYLFYNSVIVYNFNESPEIKLKNQIYVLYYYHYCIYSAIYLRKRRQQLKSKTQPVR